MSDGSRARWRCAAQVGAGNAAAEARICSVTSSPHQQGAVSRRRRGTDAGRPMPTGRRLLSDSPGHHDHVCE